MADTPKWYTQAVFYRVYVRAFCDSNADGQGDIPGLISRLPYIEDLGVNCVWLMPIFPPSQNDGSKGITDFTAIQLEYGAMDDFEALVDAVHSRGLRLIIDLEMNHTSDKHPWFISGRNNPQSVQRNYYVWSETDSRYAGVRNLSNIPRQTNWHPLTENGPFYWSRFSPALPELNYDNPEIRTEMVKVLRYWLNKGVDGFCLSGLPFLFERDETTSENLPENLKYIRAVRTFLNQNYPEHLLAGEMDQAQNLAASYLDQSSGLGFVTHPSIGAQLVRLLAEQDGTGVRTVLERTYSIPEASQWINFITGPDGLQVSQMLPEDLENLRKVFSAENQAANGYLRRLASIMDNDQRKIRLLYALLFSLPGAPAVFYGDEIGMAENSALIGKAALLGPMQWDETRGAGFSRASIEKFYLPLVDHPPFNHQMLNVMKQETDPESLLNFMKTLIRARKSHPELATGTIEWVETDNPAVAAFVRRLDEKAIFTLFNMSDRTNGARIPRDLRTDHRMDLLGGYLRLQPDLTNVTFKPYQFGWFSI